MNSSECARDISRDVEEAHNQARDVAGPIRSRHFDAEIGDECANVISDPECRERFGLTRRFKAGERCQREYPGLYAVV
jgi:hypothetical protein